MAVIAMGAGFDTPASLSIAPNARLASGTGEAYGISTRPPAVWPRHPHARVRVRGDLVAEVTVRPIPDVAVAVRSSPKAEVT